MSWAQYLYSYIKNQSIFTAGRWLLSGAMVAAAVTHVSLPVALLVVGVSGLLQGGIAWLKQRDVENQLVADYRDELSAKTGVELSKLTTKELHMVAYGDADKAIEANPVLAQAIERSSNRKLMTWGSTLAASVITLFVLLSSFGAVKDFIEPVLQAAKESAPSMLSWLLPQHVAIFTMMLVSGTGMGLLNNAFERISERMLDLNLPTAHEHIQEIRREIDKNRIITPQQVFGVFVALDPNLDQQIRAMFQRPYEKLNIEEQHDALLIFGRHLQNPQLGTHTIASLTRDLNNRQIEADELAFAVVGQDSGVPRLEKPQPRGKPKSEIEEFVQEVKQIAKGQKRYEAEEQRAEVRHQQELVAEVPSNDNVPGFAQRFVPRESGAASHVERAGVTPRDTQSTHLEREMQRLLAKLDEQKIR